MHNLNYNDINVYIDIIYVVSFYQIIKNIFLNNIRLWIFIASVNSNEELGISFPLHSQSF